MPSTQIPPFDIGNQLLGEVPALFITAIIDTPAGQRLAMTVRTASTTLTVLLSGADAKTWATQLTREAAAMSAAGLVISNGHMSIPKPQP